MSDLINTSKQILEGKEQINENKDLVDVGYEASRKRKDAVAAATKKAGADFDKKASSTANKQYKGRKVKIHVEVKGNDVSGETLIGEIASIRLVHKSGQYDFDSGYGNDDEEYDVYVKLKDYRKEYKLVSGDWGFLDFKV